MRSSRGPAAVLFFSVAALFRLVSRNRDSFSRAMDVQKIIEGIQPLAGQVVPVKTVQETQPFEDFADAYAAEVNVKCASKVIKTLDSRFTRDTSLSHLRRFAKHTQLPAALQSSIPKNEHTHTIFVLISPPIPDLDTLQALLAPFVPAPTPPENPESCPADESTHKIPFYPLRIPLQPPLNPHQAEKWTRTMWPVIFNPASPRANIAPPPQVLNRTLEAIQPRAGYYLSLAQVLAHEAEQSGLGRRVGAVVVDPAIEATLHGQDSDTAAWARAVVAVAGDARYIRREAAESEQTVGGRSTPASQVYNADLEGGPELHALMRVVDMVSRRRREDQEDPIPASTSMDADSSPDKGAYLHPLESYFLYQTDAPAVTGCSEPSRVPEKYQKTDNTTAQCTKTAEPPVSTSRIRPRILGGYLCTDLDVYLSREPCLSCSMGLLLSRFRAVIFPRGGRMVTGGLASEPIAAPVASGVEEDHPARIENRDQDKSRDPRNNRKYYGLHWRKELNWRALGFEFVEDGYLFEEMGVEGEDGVAFHA